MTTRLNIYDEAAAMIRLRHPDVGAEVIRTTTKVLKKREAVDDLLGEARPSDQPLLNLATEEYEDRTEAKLMVGGYDLSYDIEVTEEREKTYSSRYYGRPTGRYRLTVGRYGDKTSYPQKKDGSFSWDKIADKLAEMVATRRREVIKAQATRDNQQLVNVVMAETGLDRYNPYISLTPSEMSETAKPILVKVNFSRFMTEIEAKEFIQTLREAGIIAKPSR